MLELRELFVAYGRIEALRGVSMAAERGEIVAIVGARTRAGLSSSNQSSRSGSLS
jgi:ABC-type branched-subunit amino acid transport system ATPase component